VTAPAYMSLDPDNFSASFVRMPEQKEIPVPVDVQLIVEYYNRLT